MRTPISCTKWVLVLLVIITNSCKKTDIGSSIVPASKETANLVEINLNGRITDDHQIPMNGAVVRSGTIVTQTDINGNFHFSGLHVNQSATLIEVYKPGYFRTYQTLEVLPSSEQFAEISILEQSNKQQFSVPAGTNFQLPGGAAINFPANALTDRVSRQSYMGIAELSAYSMNNEDYRFFHYLPGIKGLTLNKKEVALKAFGMLVTELTGESGQALELETGKPALMKFPIPPSLLGNAPSSISLWHYDLSSGIWIEEGIAEKSGNNYQGYVSHLSIWACGIAMPLVPVKANIVDKNGNSIPFAKVQLYSGDGEQPVSNITYTDDKGFLSISSPGNQALELKVVNECQEILANKKFTAGTTANWLGKIESGAEKAATITISGKVVNCKVGGVYNGHVSLELENKTYRAAIHEGKFVITLNRCSKALVKARLVAVDDEGNLESDLQDIDITEGNYDAGTISTCNQENNQFVSYNINGTNYLLQAPSDSLVQAPSTVQNKTTILCYKGADRSKAAFSFTFSGTGKPGQFPVTALNINQDKMVFSPSGNIAVEVTDYGMPGSYIIGRCIGKLTSPALSQVLPFSFNFKILRNF
ncbi:hypothetical protein [Flavihumibacter profundi]|uniref:hypothetical protein n=1 Tax=Flavihumibacter profundi TaxID=2716883 RepID=UPI001CC3609B|nr:hypothetical protein [Flavihumibacter profundi]MBZ5855789.1 hypothetical protein [Flavihumibacter profundi]